MSVNTEKVFDNGHENGIDPKRIIITGQHNRYQVRRLTEKKALCKSRKAGVPVALRFLLSNKDVQKDSLVKILSWNNIPKHSPEILFLEKEIERKKGGYQRQDIAKGRFCPGQFITTHQIIEKLIACDMLCYYCKTDVFVVYEMVREKNQWTLDRVDNDQGHNESNVVIGCLECNLKRRRTQQSAFTFTQQLSIVRENYEEEDGFNTDNST